MSEQTEFSLQPQTPPNLPTESAPPAEASPQESTEPAKPKTRIRKVTAKTAVGEKESDPSATPKKRVTRRTKKTVPAADESTSGESTDAPGAESNHEQPEPKPRKRVTRKTKAVADEPTPDTDSNLPPAQSGESVNKTPSAPQGEAKDIPAEHSHTAAKVDDSSPIADSSESSAADPAKKDAFSDTNSREGKRGRRFRNRRRGRDRFQRREDFHENGHPGSNGSAANPPEDAEPIFEEGLVDVSGKGFGFLRKADVNFDPSHTDTFITPEVVRAHNLRDGMWIKGQIRQGHRGPQLFKLVELEGEDPEPYKNLPVFEELTVLNPLERIRLETAPNRFTTRVVDLMAPIGKGTRGLLVAPPRTGKTTILQHIAEALAINHPDIKVILLLVDERPEEVTELRRALPRAEVIASSNDSDIKSHTRIAQLGIDRAKRLVEMGKDVFVLMDSITRIGRAFNNAQGGKGRTMSGGVDSRALEIPRKLFAAARNTEEAGSLTIIGTALVETGSKMDELIFLEFKGTGNMELVLDRKISDQLIYPAADIFMSGTRREELLIPADKLHKINIIRRGLAGHKPFEAIERLLFFLQKYPTNDEMLAGIPG